MNHHSVEFHLNYNVEQKNNNKTDSIPDLNQIQKNLLNLILLLLLLLILLILLLLLLLLFNFTLFYIHFQSDNK